MFANKKNLWQKNILFLCEKGGEKSNFAAANIEEKP